MFDTLPEDLKYSKYPLFYVMFHSVINHRVILDLVSPVYYDESHSNFAQSEDVGMDSNFTDIDLYPLRPAAAVEPDHQVNLTIDFQVTTDGKNRGFFNGLPYLAPKTPTLNTMLSQGEYAMDAQVYGPQSRAIILDHLDMVEVVLNNLDAGAHPCKSLFIYLMIQCSSHDSYSPFAWSRVPNCCTWRRCL